MGIAIVIISLCRGLGTALVISRIAEETKGSDESGRITFDTDSSIIFFKKFYIPQLIG